MQNAKESKTVRFERFVFHFAICESELRILFSFFFQLIYIKKPIANTVRNCFQMRLQATDANSIVLKMLVLVQPSELFPQSVKLERAYTKIRGLQLIFMIIRFLFCEYTMDLSMTKNAILHKRISSLLYIFTEQFKCHHG